MDEETFSRNLMSRQLEQQEANDPNAVYADTLREDKVNNILGQNNPDKLVIDIENRIRGKKKNPVTMEWEDISKTKKVSEELIADIVSYLGAFLNDNTTLSNYSTDEINGLMEKVIDYLKDGMADNDEKYGLAKKDYIEKNRKVTILIDIGNGKTRTEEDEMTETILVREEVDYHEMTRICDIICHEVFATLKRAINGNESRRIFGALRVTGDLNPQPQKKGFMDAMQFWK